MKSSGTIQACEDPTASSGGHFNSLKACGMEDHCCCSETSFSFLLCAVFLSQKA